MGACTGPKRGPVRAKSGVFCSHGYTEWTGTSSGKEGARAVARNSAFSEREREGRGVPAGMTASV